MLPKILFFFFFFVLINNRFITAALLFHAFIIFLLISNNLYTWVRERERDAQLESDNFVILLLLLCSLFLISYHSPTLGRSPCPQGGESRTIGSNPPTMSYQVIDPATKLAPPMKCRLILELCDSQG